LVDVIFESLFIQLCGHRQSLCSLYVLLTTTCISTRHHYAGCSVSHSVLQHFVVFHALWLCWQASTIRMSCRINNPNAVHTASVRA